ncbi:MAG: hypothetical protein H7321_02660 [Bacteroidia bacterium]|nr:hypothetical protein [Bacteroidia bacterium]
MLLIFDCCDSATYIGYTNRIFNCYKGNFQYTFLCDYKGEEIYNLNIKGPQFDSLTIYGNDGLVLSSYHIIGSQDLKKIIYETKVFPSPINFYMVYQDRITDTLYVSQDTVLIFDVCDHDYDTIMQYTIEKFEEDFATEFNSDNTLERQSFLISPDKILRRIYFDDGTFTIEIFKINQDFTVFSERYRKLIEGKKVNRGQ